jgi:MFS family permease
LNETLPLQWQYTYAFSLSAGSQFGPLIGGYLIAARGWRWFFNLLIILVADNRVVVVFTFPETTYKRIYLADETAADYEEKTHETKYVEAIQSVEEQHRVTASAKFSYSENVLFIRHQNVEGGGVKNLLYLAMLPLEFLLVPAAIFTTILYGIVLGW